MANLDHGRFCLALVANHICSSSLSASGWSRRLPNRTIVLFLALPYCYIAFFLWESGGEEEGGCCFSCAVAAMTSSSSLRFSCFIYDIFTGNHSLERCSTVVIGVVCLLHLLLFSLPVVASPDWAALDVDAGAGGVQLFREILRDEAVARLNELAKVSDADAYLERTFFSPASLRATDLIRCWMEDAGLRTWVDQMGNLHGRTESTNSTAETLLIGSHFDTVIDAGKYDGALGIVCAISALEVLKFSGKLHKLRRPIEVIAFSDEEGVRFQSTFLGSAAIAGSLPASTLQIADKSGMTIKDILKQHQVEASEETLFHLKYSPHSVLGYIEVHIEQGPVLESLGQPLGIVKGIAGQTRLKVTVKGTQGHAGTVPMSMRQDPMPAAAELIVFLESLCKYPETSLTYNGQCSGFKEKSIAGSLVCTVGEISSWPSASNVIPGQVVFTVDVRATDDMVREAIIYEYSKRIHRICDERSVFCTVERKHDANAVHFDGEWSSELKYAAHSAGKKLAGDVQIDVPELMSGAGHDAMVMSQITKVAMLFVRCRGGVSHSPAEHVLDDDVWAAGLALVTYLESSM